MSSYEKKTWEQFPSRATPLEAPDLNDWETRIDDAVEAVEEALETIELTPGEDGKTWHSGTGAPSGGLGVDGDFYLDTAADAYYGPKTSGSWGDPTGLVGPAGEDGEDGADGSDGDNGADGKTILYGTAAPTSEGVNGDFYIRTTTNFIYGPKASGSWPSGTSLVGPKGDDGDDGADGADGDSWVPSPVGQDDGKVLTVDTDDAVWAEASSGPSGPLGPTDLGWDETTIEDLEENEIAFPVAMSDGDSGWQSDSEFLALPLSLLESLFGEVKFRMRFRESTSSWQPGDFFAAWSVYHHVYASDVDLDGKPTGPLWDTGGFGQVQDFARFLVRKESDPTVWLFLNGGVRDSYSDNKYYFDTDGNGKLAVMASAGDLSDGDTIEITVAYQGSKGNNGATGPAGARSWVAVNARTSNTNLASGDIGDLSTMNHATDPRTFTLPNSLSGITNGDQIHLMRIGAGTVSLVGGTSVVINGVTNPTIAMDQWATYSITRISSNNYLLSKAAAP